MQPYTWKSLLQHALFVSHYPGNTDTLWDIWTEINEIEEEDETETRINTKMLLSNWFSCREIVLLVASWHVLSLICETNNQFTKIEDGTG